MNLPEETPPKDGNQARLRAWFAILTADAADIRRAYAFSIVAWDTWPERWEAILDFKAKHDLPWTDHEMQENLSYWANRVPQLMNRRRRVYL